MSTYAVADLHIGYNWSDKQYHNIWQFLAQLSRDDRVFFLGDTFEYAWRTEEEIHSSPEFKKFKLLLQKHHIHAVMIYGNHDLGYGLEFGEHNNTCLMHGHQFDILADTWWKRWYYHLAPWVRNIWFDSPWQQKQNASPDWQHHNGFIAGRALRWLENSQYNSLIIGHTHDCIRIDRPESGKQLFLIGSLPEDKVYFDLDNKQYKFL